MNNNGPWSCGAIIAGLFIAVIGAVVGSIILSGQVPAYWSQINLPTITPLRLMLIGLPLVLFYALTITRSSSRLFAFIGSLGFWMIIGGIIWAIFQFIRG
jgi:hypothetical protein